MRKRRLRQLGLSFLLLVCLGSILYKVIGHGLKPAHFPSWNATPTRQISAHRDREFPKTNLDHPILEGEFKVTQKVNAIAFSQDGSLLAVAADGKELELWDARKRILRRRFVDTFAYGQRVTSLAFSPSGQFLASAEDIFENYRMGGNDIRFWDISTGTLQRSIVVNRSPFDISKGLRATDTDATVYMKSIAFLPDGNTLLASLNICSTASRTQAQIREWDLPTGKVKLVWPHEKAIDSTTLSPDGNTLALGRGDRIELWDIQTAQLLRTLYQSPSHGVAGTLAFSSDGGIIACAAGPQVAVYTGSPEGMVDQLFSVHFWLESGKYLGRLSDRQPGTVTAVTFSPDGERLVVATSTAIVRVYRMI